MLASDNIGHRSTLQLNEQHDRDMSPSSTARGGEAGIFMIPPVPLQSFRDDEITGTQAGECLLLDSRSVVVSM